MKPQKGTSPAAVRAAIALTPNPFQKVSDTTSIIQDAIDAETKPLVEALERIAGPVNQYGFWRAVAAEALRNFRNPNKCTAIDYERTNQH